MGSSSKLIARLQNKEYILSKLTKDSIIKPFDCDNNDLNDFLINDAKMYLKYLRYTTFVIEDENEIIAYYSLANDVLRLSPYIDKELKGIIKGSVENQDFKFKEYMLRQDSFPAVKIGRLAVHKDFQRQGYGTDIIELLMMSFIKNNKTGCQFITVDALNNQCTQKFYMKNDFLHVTVADNGRESRQMYKFLFQ